MTSRVLTGDVLRRLAELPERSIQCCITSPPYWGLRDYGVKGQLGLERTPEGYVAKMVEVFAEVRRALQNDGTLWLNIGDSYASDPGKGGSGTFNGRNGNGEGHARARLGNYCDPKQGKAAEGQPRHHARPGAGRADGIVDERAQRNRDGVPKTHGLKAKDLVGIPWMLAFALRAPWTDWQIKSEAMRAWVAGIVDADGCITILRTKSSHSDSLSYPPVVQVHMCDTEPLQRLVDVAGSSFGAPQMPPSHLAANQRESYQWKVVSDRAAKIIAEIYPYLTCKRKQAIVAYNHQMFRSERGNQERKNGDLEKEQFCKDLINKLNQRQPVDIPSWMIEPHVVQTPGWYLRQDCIWAKPNPMPESVTDRCTKSHEYLFLLTKSPKYFFDAEAIKEPAAAASVSRWAQDVENQRGSDRVPGKTNGPMKAVGGPASRKLAEQAIARTGGLISGGTGTSYPTRNKRDVWTVATQPFSGAHFATFPTKLVEPCLLAGTGEGSTVLDPFCGSGTVGVVAKKWGCDFIGIELNPKYAAMARRRIANGK